MFLPSKKYIYNIYLSHSSFVILPVKAYTKLYQKTQAQTHQNQKIIMLNPNSAEKLNS